MASSEYSVYISEQNYSDGRFGIKAIEIAPPVSREFAQFICQSLRTFLDGQSDARAFRDMATDAGYRETVIAPYGFCDEGATVSTLLQMVTTPTFEQSSVTWPDKSGELQSLVEGTLSPSGAFVTEHEHSA